LLQSVEIPTDKNLIVGVEKPDDAGVYKITDEIALVQTLDFFTPIPGYGVYDAGSHLKGHLIGWNNMNFQR